VHFRHVSAKIQPKNLKQHFDWGARVPLDPSPGYALAQDLKKRSLTEKINSVMPVLPSHAGNRKKKKTDYYRLSSQVMLHPKLGS